MLPTLGREVVEREQRVTILRRFLNGLRIFGPIRVDELVERDDRVRARRGVPDLSSAALAFACCDFGMTFGTLPNLWNQQR